MDFRLILLALGAFAGTTESAVLPGLLPSIGTTMGVSIAQAGLLVFVYSISYAIAAPLLSSVFSAMDRRRVLTAAELLFGLSALAMAIAPDFVTIVAARAVLAAAAVLFTSMAQATAYAISPPGRRGRSVGIVMSGATLAVAIGAPIGALVGQQFGWRVSYGLVAALAASAGIIMWFRLPAGIRPERQSLRERLGVLGNRGVPAALVISLLFAGGIFPPGIYVAAITTQSMLMEAGSIPLMLLAGGLGAVAGGVLGGQLTDRLGAFRTFLLFAVAGILLLVAMSLVPHLPHMVVAPLWLLIFALLSLLGWGLYAAQVALLAALAPNGVPLAISLNLTASNIGGAFAAIYAGQAIERFGAGSIGLFAALFAVAALGVALANRQTLRDR